MRVAIHTLGTRGDVQPYLALALGLQAAGHDVQLAAPSQFEAFVGIHGVRFAHLPGEFLDLMETPEAMAAMSGKPGFAAGFKMLKQFRPVGRKLLTAEWSAAKAFTPELIIYHPKAIGAPHIGEKLGCPTVLASPLPGFTPTRQFASPLLPYRSLGPLNRMTHRLMAKSGSALFGSMIAGWRVEDLGLTAWSSRSQQPAATLYAYSPQLLPVPADWPDNVAVTGTWVLEEESDWQPEGELKAFLEAGDAPVYVGFGSMPGHSPEKLTATVVEALDIAGKRGVLATGGGALNAVFGGSPVFAIGSAPHDKLFPLMAACVHHGGAGTTAASLRAGKPTVICPFFGDQPFWGRRVRELGVGPTPLPINWLTPEALAAAIGEATSDPGIRQRAVELGSRMSAENGVAEAIDFLERQGLVA